MASSSSVPPVPSWSSHRSAGAPLSPLVESPSTKKSARSGKDPRLSAATSGEHSPSITLVRSSPIQRDRVGRMVGRMPIRRSPSMHRRSESTGASKLWRTARLDGSFFPSFKLPSKLRSVSDNGGPVGTASGSGGAQQAPPVAWPVDRRWGWRLVSAWCFNQVLFLGGLVWLAIMLRALDVDEQTASAGAFWRTYMVALCQSFFIQEPIKVILISFISPPFWAKILKPGTKRAEALRAALRASINVLTPLL
jgi:hypothetical protein